MANLSPHYSGKRDIFENYIDDCSAYWDYKMLSENSCALGNYVLLSFIIDLDNWRYFWDTEHA